MGTQELEPGLLAFDLEGEMTLDGLIAAGRGIVAACAERKAARAMADARRMSGDLSITDWYQLAVAFETNWPDLRLAVVDRADRLKPDRFLETTARNRGINLGVFDDPAPALRWLRTP